MYKERASQLIKLDRVRLHRDLPSSIAPSLFLVLLLGEAGASGNDQVTRGSLSVVVDGSTLSAKEEREREMRQLMNE
jgi:hypothetical protein